jgi:hypothetical protein
MFAEADSRAETIAAKDAARGIEKQEIRSAVVERERRENLKRERIAAVAQRGCARAALERETQQAVAAGAARIRREGRGGSSR